MKTSTFTTLRRGLLAAALVGGSLLATAPAHAGIVFDFPTFGSACGTTLTCVNNTSETGGVLRLAPTGAYQSGAGYSTTPITLGANATFSTTFRFQFTSPGGIDPADGIVFTLAAASAGLGGAGGGIGYEGVRNSVGIEFDTYNNGGLDLSSNHVAIDTNGVLNNIATVNPYGVSQCHLGDNSYKSFGCMTNGDIWTITIGYDGSLLTVKAQDGNAAVLTLIDAYAIDIANLLGTNTAYVGFTSATGSGWQNHDILSWQLANDTSIITPPPTTGVPEPLSAGLLGLGLVAMAVSRRRRNG